MTPLPLIAHRLWTGSEVLGLRLWNRACSWCAKSYRHDLTGLKAALGPIARGGLIAGAGWLATYGVAAAPDVLLIIALAWGIGAWNMAPVQRPASGEEAPAALSETEQEGPALIGKDELCALVRKLAQGGAGAHLSALAEHLPDGPHDASAVRALCTQHGVPVAKSVRQSGRGVSTGVKVADLPPLSPLPPEGRAVAVVVAGQDGTTGAATTTTTPSIELHFDGSMQIVRDPARRAQAVRKSVHEY
ncbi:hypothetical protein [Streptomyces sp. URMC 124]|uniref:hypothetical protein n=1 Tax=Streptomyces sp. URMC 124 TaxID=3423405 RepID=UPI003F1A111E